MYKKPQYRQNGNSSDKELIDISSDDDASKVDSKTEKDLKTPESGCTAAEESSGVMVAAKSETTKLETARPETAEPETTILKQETAKPEMSTIKPETLVKSNIVCISMQFMIMILC